MGNSSSNAAKTNSPDPIGLITNKCNHQPNIPDRPTKKSKTSEPDVIDVITNKCSRHSKTSSQRPREQTLADMALELFGESFFSQDQDLINECLGFDVDMNTPVTEIPEDQLVVIFSHGQNIIACQRNGHHSNCRCLNCRPAPHPANHSPVQQKPASQPTIPSPVQQNPASQSIIPFDDKGLAIMVVTQVVEPKGKYSFSDAESDHNVDHHRNQSYRKTPNDDDIWDRPSPVPKRPTTKLEALRLDAAALGKLAQSIRGGANVSSSSLGISSIMNDSHTNSIDSLNDIINEASEEMAIEAREDSTTEAYNSEEPGSDDELDDLDIDDDDDDEDNEGEIRRVQRHLFDAESSDRPKAWQKHIRVWQSSDYEGGQSDSVNSNLTDDYEKFIRRNNMNKALNHEQQKIFSMRSESSDANASDANASDSDKLFRRPINTNSRYR
jgi:hypothetical protein